MRAFFVLLLFSLSFSRVHSITAGQKIAIQKVPFIALGESIYNGAYRRFSGIILDEKLVLTMSSIVHTYKNITLKVGTADLKSFLVPKTYMVRRVQYNKILAILEVLDGPFPFGATVQRAMLVPYTENPLPEQMYFVAGYGSLNHDVGFPQELHARPVHLTYKNVPVDQHTTKFLMWGLHNQNLVLYTNDMGGPVWNIDTGEVVGVVTTVEEELGHGKIVQIGLPIAVYRNWIDDIRAKMHMD